jgi:TonB family protein
MNDLLMESAIRSTVVLSTAWIVALILRRASADLRHKVWLAALIGVAFSLVSMPVPEPFRFVIAVQAGGAPGLAASIHWSIALTVAWAAGMTLLLVRSGLGLARLARMTSRARRMGSEGFLVSDSVTTPMTWGVLRPVILLPAYIANWPAEKRDAVILHEQAHVERRDWMWQTFAQAVIAVFGFHPLVWLAAIQLRQEAERAADDRVLAEGIQAAEYAGQLVEVARRLRGRVPQESVAMVREPILTSRVTAILDSTYSRGRTGRWSRAAIVISSSLLLVFLAACQSARIYKVAQVTTPPHVISKIEPQYTEQARAQKIQGKVVLTMIVNPDGRADHFRVVRSLDKGMDAKAIAAIEQWTFEPGKKDGKPVRVAATIEVNFHLL